MASIFDALKQMPKREPKKFFVTVEGKDYEVSLEKKKWAIMHGEENLIIKDGEITVKPPPKPRTQHKTLAKADKGYFFYSNDIHWPNEIAEGGVTWQTSSE
mgnify:FL=1|tara:strand:+ start:1533 stop:1835 length:303 start_codon:yes stop_codon:yes gene_type:complete